LYQNYVNIRSTVPAYNYGSCQLSYQNFVPNSQQSRPIVGSQATQLRSVRIDPIPIGKQNPATHPHPKPVAQPVAQSPGVDYDLIDLSAQTECKPNTNPFKKADDLNVPTVEMKMNGIGIEYTRMSEPSADAFRADAVKEITACFDSVSVINKTDVECFSDGKSMTKTMINRSTNPFLDSDDDSTSSESEGFVHTTDQTVVKNEVPAYHRLPFRIPDNTESSIQEGSTFRIYVAQVHSPSRFWFQNVESSLDLDQLILDMR
jgi:hypothetical protein